MPKITIVGAASFKTKQDGTPFRHIYFTMPSASSNVSGLVTGEKNLYNNNIDFVIGCEYLASWHDNTIDDLISL